MVTTDDISEEFAVSLKIRGGKFLRDVYPTQKTAMNLDRREILKFLGRCS
jgi:hypothetical protein